MPLSTVDAIRRDRDELTAIRHDIHAHPELGLEEHRTAELVARKLEGWGIEVHRGVGKTGVVGVLRAGAGNRAIGLRADMDALPMQEQTELPFRSITPGKMHACGHDGHTAMLLGAAKYLAETRASAAPSILSFSPERRAAAVHWPCCTMACSSVFPATSSTACTIAPAWT